MVFKDYYKILNLDNTQVEFEEIRHAYRSQAKKYHPDRNKENTEERIQDINEAYRVLSNPTSKRKYDRKWRTYIERNKMGNKTYEARVQNKSFKEEVYTMFFGEIKNKIKKDKKIELPNIKGENIRTEISISLKDAFYGAKKHIALRDVKGTLQRIPVEIPLGIQEGDKIRIIGFGKPGQNKGKNGDLFVNIKIKNENDLELQGKNIKTKVNIYPWEAALGTTTKVKVLEEELTLKIPAGTQSGKRFEVENKGYHDGFGGRGNLLIDVIITIPNKISDKELELYRKLEKIRTNKQT